MCDLLVDTMHERVKFYLLHETCEKHQVFNTHQFKSLFGKNYLIKPRKTHRKQYILKSGDGWTCRPVTCNVSRNKDLNVFNECFSEY